MSSRLYIVESQDIDTGEWVPFTFWLNELRKALIYFHPGQPRTYRVRRITGVAEAEALADHPNKTCWRRLIDDPSIEWEKV